MAALRDRHSELRSLGFGLVAVSVDEPKRSRALVDELDLPFPLLSDAARAVVRAYGVFNEKEKGGIAYPATFVVDRDRTVRFRSLDKTVARVELDGLFEFLRNGVGSTAPDKPARTRLSPSARDMLRIVARTIRFGIRSPKPKAGRL